MPHLQTANPVNLVIMGHPPTKKKQQQKKTIIMPINSGRKEKQLKELTKKHLHHFTFQTFSTSPPSSEGLLCHYDSHIVQQKPERWNKTFWLPLLVQGSWHLSVKHRPKTSNTWGLSGRLLFNCSSVTHFGSFSPLSNGQRIHPV